MKLTARPLAGLLLAFMALGSVAPSHAEFVDFVAEGTVDSVLDFHRTLDGSVARRVPMRAIVSYDTAAPGEEISDTQNWYRPLVPPSLLRFEVGTYSIEVPDYRIAVLDDFFGTSDSYGLRSHDGFPFPGLPGVWIGVIAVGFEDPTGTIFQGTGLPTTPPVLADFENAQITLQACLDSEITSSGFCPGNPAIRVIASVIAIPEPAAAMIGVSAMVALAGVAIGRGRPLR